MIKSYHQKQTPYVEILYKKKKEEILDSQKKKNKKKKRRRRRRRKALTCLHLSLNASEDYACGAALVLWFKRKNQLYLE